MWSIEVTHHPHRDNIFQYHLMLIQWPPHENTRDRADGVEPFQLNCEIVDDSVLQILVVAREFLFEKRCLSKFVRQWSSNTLTSPSQLAKVLLLRSIRHVESGANIRGNVYGKWYYSCAGIWRRWHRWDISIGLLCTWVVHRSRLQ